METPRRDYPFPGLAWFVAPDGPYQDVDELVEAIVTGFFVDDLTGEPLPVVYAFTDEGLAAEHMRRSGAGPIYRPIAPGDDDRLTELLQRLLAHGHQNLGIDSERSDSERPSC